MKFNGSWIVKNDTLLNQFVLEFRRFKAYARRASGRFRLQSIWASLKLSNKVFCEEFLDFPMARHRL
jgi:hypothetical protein